LQSRWRAAGSVCCFQQASLSRALPMATSWAQAWYNISSMKDILEKTSRICLLILDVNGAQTDGSLELLSRARGTIDGSKDGNG